MLHLFWTCIINPSNFFAPLAFWARSLVAIKRSSCMASKPVEHHSHPTLCKPTDLDLICKVKALELYVNLVYRRLANQTDIINNRQYGTRGSQCRAIGVDCSKATRTRPR